MVAGLSCALGAWDGLDEDWLLLPQALIKRPVGTATNTSFIAEANASAVALATPEPLALYSPSGKIAVHEGDESSYDELSFEAYGVLSEPFTPAVHDAGAEDVAEYVIPVSGVAVHELRNDWGAPRSGGRRHEGIDILAPAGTPVVASVDGTVVFASFRPLGGNSILIDGVDGRQYYYAHLSGFDRNLSVGKEVDAGERIGYVGNTGNAMHTASHLHFGIYAYNRAQNPFTLLVNGAGSGTASAVAVNLVREEISTANTVRAAAHVDIAPQHTGLYGQIEAILE